MLTTLWTSITIFVGIAVTFILPDFPETWSSLSPELRSVATKRMAMDAAKADVDVGGRSSVWNGFKMAFTDPKVSIYGSFEVRRGELNGTLKSISAGVSSDGNVSRNCRSHGLPELL